MKINLFDLKVGESVDNVFIAKTCFIQEHKSLQRISKDWFLNEKFDKVLIFKDDFVFDNKKEALQSLLRNLENKIEQVKQSLKEYPA